MKLKNIAAIAALQLGKIYSDESFNAFVERAIIYASEAQNEIAKAIKFTATEDIFPERGLFQLSMFSRYCVKVISVIQQGHEVRYRFDWLNNQLVVPYDSPATCTYLCYPKPILSAHDETELPDYTYGLFVAYISAKECQHLFPDKEGNIYLSMYNAAIKDLGRKGLQYRICVSGEHCESNL